MPLDWRRCGDDGHWCDLATLDLNSITAGLGVYLIWHDGSADRDYTAQVVPIGEGDITERLGAHRLDNEIMGYGVFGNLLVTWAAVAGGRARRQRIERYLADRWTPALGEYPDTEPLTVNGPWD